MTAAMQHALFADESTSKAITHVPLDQLSVSRFNPRATRPEADVVRLAERMQRNGFEITRALWVYPVAGGYEVFAGGTRLAAAQHARLSLIPVVVHEGFSEDAIVRLADQDNENDEYHTSVALPDVWADYWRLNKVEGWTQQRIADAKGVERDLVTRRIGWHERLPKIARTAVCDKTLDEGHLIAISGLACDVTLRSWLTTEQAQTELTAELLGKYQKPTVRAARDAADAWKKTIATAEAHYRDLPDEWRARFVEVLASTKARTMAAVHQALGAVTREREAQARKREEDLARQRSAAEAEALRLKHEAERAARIESILTQIVHGDARRMTTCCPDGIALVLTDPPYGQDWQSNRRVVAAKTDKIAGDNDIERACELLFDVLTDLSPKLAEHSTVLVWCRWQNEPAFRETIASVGLAVKGSLIWNKPNHGTGDLDGTFAPKHERILHAVRGAPKLRRRLDDVLEGGEFLGTDHPTEKPCDLLRALIGATTDAGDLVVDPFAGVGSSVVAAYDTGRTFWACELDEGYHRTMTGLVYARLSAED